MEATEEIITFRKKILETIDWSAQLQERDKNFSKLFLKSDYFDVV